MTPHALTVLVPDTLQGEPPEVDGVRFVGYDAAETIPAEHEGAEVLVTWGAPAGHLSLAADRMRHLRLVQSLAAGTENIEGAGFAPDVALCSGVGLHDRPVAEHALALVLAAARSLHVAADAKAHRRWASEIGGVQKEPDPERFTTLRGARVLIWGFGGIARTLAPHLIALGATVTGVARSARETDGVHVIAVDDISDELRHTDVLINILPASPETQGIVDAAVLARLPRHAWLVNVGRGVTVNEDALLTALREGRLGGAALDVTAQEPLPATSSLWDEPNIILTPHAAGGRPLGAKTLIEANVRALLTGGELRNRVR